MLPDQSPELVTNSLHPLLQAAGYSFKLNINIYFNLLSLIIMLPKDINNSYTDLIKSLIVRNEKIGSAECESRNGLVD